MGAKKQSYDVIVVGGGIAGLSLTALLAAGGGRVLCLDREKVETQLAEKFDGRTTAISYGSRLILQAAGLWEALENEACAIDTIEILDGDSPTLLTFNSREAGGNSFGWIVENRRLRQTLLARVKALKTAEHRAQAAVADFERDEDGVAVILADGKKFHAPLVVGADGRQSFTRESMGIGTRTWPYNQRAIVCVAAHEKPHDNVAVEHFRHEGPFAILPMADDADGQHRSSIVWTEHGPESESALRYNQISFDAALTARFPQRYGRAWQCGQRFSYPLGLTHAHDYIAPRMALVAEAAHAIHPIAGQGLNIGLRDIAVLADLVMTAVRDGKDPGTDDLLQAYQRQRRMDNMAMAGATDTLNRLFSNDIGPVRLARRVGLRAVSRLPFAKQFFMKQAMGAVGILPDLIRDHLPATDKAA